MGRARERFLLKEEERRRTGAGCALALAFVGLFVVIAAVVAWRLNDSGPPPGELVRVVGTLVAIPLVLLGVGLFLRLRPRNFVSVDADAGTATFVRGGAAVVELPLAEIGPLEHVVERRRVKSGKSHRIAVFHVARSGAFHELRLFESEKELETRRALEARAKAWRLPYVKPSGEVRNPEELDVPLFQRLGSDEAARATLPQRPGSSLAVAWREGGYEVTTSYRPPLDRATLIATFVVPPVILGWAFGRRLLDAFREGPSTPFLWGAVGAVVLSFVPGLVVAGKAWRRVRFPPSIRVSADGVRFRGRRLPLRSIEEVERVAGGAARLVSDERLLVIDADFCEPSEHEWLQHELRRLVIEVGQQSPAG